MPASRLSHAVGGVELGLGVLCLVFGALELFGIWRGGDKSDLAGFAFLGAVTLLPIGATAVLGGFAARRGWRAWYAYACLSVLTARAIVFALHTLLGL